MSNEMFKTVILNVFYVMHILKLTFILNFALIGQYILTNRILQWESVMYISSSTICCFAYFNLSRLKLSVTTWPLNLSKRPKMTTSCSRAPSGDHFEEIGHFLGCSIISDFGGLETIKIRWAENPEKIDTVTSEFGSNPHQKGRVKIYEFNLSCKYYIETVLYSKAKNTVAPYYVTKREFYVTLLWYVPNFRFFLRRNFTKISTFILRAYGIDLWAFITKPDVSTLIKPNRNWKLV